MMQKLWRWLSARRIRMQTLIVSVGVVCAVLIMLVFTALFTSDVWSFVQEQSTDVYTRQTETLARRIDTSLSKVRGNAELLRADEALESLVLKIAQAQNVTQQVELQDDIYDLLSRYSSTADNVRGTAILTDKCLISTADFFYMENIQTLQACLEGVQLDSLPAGLTLLCTSRPWNYRRYTTLPQGTLFYASPLYDGDRLAAVYVVFLNQQFLSNLMIDQNDYAVLLDGQLIYGDETCVPSDPQAVRAGEVLISTQEDSEARIFSRSFAEGSMVLSRSEDLNAVYASVEMMQKVLMGTILLCIFIAWFFGQKIFAHMLTPMKALHAQVTAYEQGGSAAATVTDKPRTQLSLQTRLILFLLLTVLTPVLLYLGAYYFTAYSCIHSTLVSAYESAIQTSADDIELTLQEQRNLLSTLSYSQSQPGSDQPLSEQYAHICQLWNVDLNLIALQDEGVSFSSDVLLGRLYTPPDVLPTPGISLGKPTPALASRQYLPMYSVYLHAYQSMSMPDFRALVNLIDLSTLSSAYSDLPLARVRVAICDTEGTILSSTSPELIGTQLDAQTAESYKFTLRSPQFELSLHFDYDENSLVNDINALLFARVYQILALFLLLLMAFSWICRVMVRPLEHIRGLLDRHELEEIDELYQGGSIITEVDALGNSFNKMKNHIDELMDDLMRTRMQTYQVEIDRRDAEIHSLQSQIHPHFLCNLLETICYLNIDGRHQEANSMLRELGNLFRYSLTKEQPLVPLEEDLAYTKAFANILQRKYENVSFVWDVDENAAKKLVLRLLIQPLVENAVLHGVNARSGGTVHISIHEQDGGLAVTVTDDGIGMDPKSVRFGVGLKNVKKRIELYYRDAGRFDIDSVPGLGTCVRLFLPGKVEDA